MLRRIFQDPNLLRFLIVFGILWNVLFGVTDYILVQIDHPEYMLFKAWLLNVPPYGLDGYYKGWPEYARVGWVMNAFGGLAGSILLLFRDRQAVWMFGLSIIGLILVSYLFYDVPQPRVAGDPWGEWLAVLRNGLALVSGLHSLAIILMINRFTSPFDGR